MKVKLFGLIAISYISLAPVLAYGWGNDVYVNGYTKQNGTYVEPHHRTKPDNSQWNNYNSPSNTNHYHQPKQGDFPRYNSSSNSNSSHNSNIGGLNSFGNNEGYRF